MFENKPVGKMGNMRPFPSDGDTRGTFSTNSHPIAILAICALRTSN